jgi:hypothetical protein
MREHSKTKVSTPNTLDTYRINYEVSRQGVKDLQKRCVFLLEILDAEGSNGRLEKVIAETNE